MKAFMVAVLSASGAPGSVKLDLSSAGSGPCLSGGSSLGGSLGSGPSVGLGGGLGGSGLGGANGGFVGAGPSGFGFGGSAPSVCGPGLNLGGSGAGPSVGFAPGRAGPSASGRPGGVTGAVSGRPSGGALEVVEQDLQWVSLLEGLVHLLQVDPAESLVPLADVHPVQHSVYPSFLVSQPMALAPPMATTTLEATDMATTTTVLVASATITAGLAMEAMAMVVPVSITVASLLTVVPGASAVA
uniref:Putative glycine rich protein n=1 Tax=Rhipicephalus pulchellus TaxID=72859 RepID=L7M9Q9_RHIPC